MENAFYKKSRKMYNPNKSKKLYLSITIFLLLLTSVTLISIKTFSKYLLSKDISATAEVATPIINFSDQEISCKIDNMLPGDMQECTFAVTNSSNNKTTETTLDYYFLLNLDSEIPLNLDMYDITNSSNELKLSIVDGKVQNDNMIMKYDEFITRKYRVEIKWNPEDNEYNYAGKPININIKLVGSQVINNV